MNPLIEAAIEYLSENWPRLITLLIAAVASFFAGRAAQSRWKKRDFLHRLNVSLTTLDAGTLRIRTLLEMDCDEIFLNPSASKEVVKLARKTTVKDPILPIPKDDCWQYLNAILNEVSERFAEGQIKRDLCLPVERGDYVLCLTREAAGNVRTQKLRCIIVRKSLLSNVPEEQPKFESPTHITRWETLQILSQQFSQNPHRFLEMEICL